MKAKKIALYGLLIALAMLLSWVESLIPLPLPAGVKVGLANLVVLIALYELGPADALVLSLVRVLLVSFTFGNMSAMLYSLAGSILSFFVMLLLYKTKVFGMAGVSVAGGVAHNLGQLIVAGLVLQTDMRLYLPVLLFGGVIAGVVIGLLGAEIARRIHGVMQRLK